MKKRKKIRRRIPLDPVVEEFRKRLTTPELRAAWIRGTVTRQAAPILLDIVNGLQEYWPLSVRQVYYRAISDSRLDWWLKGLKGKYGVIQPMINKLGVDGIIEEHAILDNSTKLFEDREPPGYSVEAFIADEAEDFLNPGRYYRDLLEGQTIYLEIWVEKRALGPIIAKAANPYDIIVAASPGFIKRPALFDYRKRIELYGERKELVVLWIGDHDPSGEYMSVDFERRAAEQQNLNISVERIALTPEQIVELEEDGLASEIPVNPKDPNYRWWCENWSQEEKCYEVDALHPSVLQQVIKNKITDYLDMDLFRQMQEEQDADREIIKAKRKQLLGEFMIS